MTSAPTASPRKDQWPYPTTPLADLSKQQQEQKERRDSLKEPGASEVLLALAEHSPMENELFQTAVASHI